MSTELLIILILGGLVIFTTCIVIAVWLSKRKTPEPIKRTRYETIPAQYNPLPASPPPPPPQHEPVVERKQPPPPPPLQPQPVARCQEVDPIHLKLIMAFDLPEGDITLAARAVAVDGAGRPVGDEAVWEMASTFNKRMVWNTTRDLRVRRCDCDGVRVEFVTARGEVYAVMTIHPGGLVVGKTMDSAVETVDGNTIMVKTVNMPQPKMRKIAYLLKLPGDLDPQTGLTPTTRQIAEEMKSKIHGVVQEHRELLNIDRITTGPTVAGVQVAFITLSNLLGNCRELGVSRYAKLAADFKPASTSAFVESIKLRTEEVYVGEPGVAARYLSSFPIDANELGTSSEQHDDATNINEVYNQLVYAGDSTVLLVLPPTVYYHFLSMLVSPVVPSDVKDDALSASSFSLFKLGLDTTTHPPIVSLNPLISAHASPRHYPTPSSSMLTPHPTFNRTPSISSAPPSLYPAPSAPPTVAREENLARRELTLGGREVAVLMREKELERIGMSYPSRGRGRGRGSWY